MKILSLITNILPTQTVFAHCDIPCGIYDPYPAQIAAHSVIRMTQLLQEAEKDSDDVAREHKVARFTKVKEDHAEIAKHEVRVIWGDYFKEEHIKEYPQLHELVFNIMKAASKARQNIDMTAAEELLSKIQEFSEIFYKTKGVTPVRIKSLYPTEGEMVVYK